MPQMMMLASEILWRLQYPFLLSHGKSHFFSFSVLLVVVMTSTIGGQRQQSSLTAVKGKVTAAVVFEELGSK